MEEDIKEIKASLLKIINDSQKLLKQVERHESTVSTIVELFRKSDVEASKKKIELEKEAESSNCSIQVCICYSLYTQPTFNTERYESYNSLMRAQNIFSNKQAPSKDIANSFSTIQYLRLICEGGSLNNARSGNGLQELYHTPEVQALLNSVNARELYPDKAMYQPGCLRKLVHGTADIRLGDVLFKMCYEPNVSMRLIELLLENTLVTSQHISVDTMVKPYYGAIEGRLLDGLVNVGVEVLDETVKYGVIVTCLDVSSLSLDCCIMRKLEPITSADESPVMTEYETKFIPFHQNFILLLPLL